MGISIRRWLWTRVEDIFGIRVWAFHRVELGGECHRVLSGGKVIRTRGEGITGEEETTGTFRAAGGGGTIGVWVLL